MTFMRGSDDLNRSIRACTLEDVAGLREFALFLQISLNTCINF